MSLLEKMRGDKKGWYKVSDLVAGAEIAVPSQTGEMIWDEIVSIKPVGREQVYDIEVESTHNFVGNDIFAHNTYLLRADPSTNVVSMGGPVGIGTTTPPALLSLQGISSTGDLFSIASSSGASVFYVNSSGSVGVGTPTPQHTLDVAGDIGAISFVNTSTRALKTSINYSTASSTDDMLNQLVNLKVATYRYTIEDQQDPLRIGLIAEDTAIIAPEILSPNQKGVDIYKLATFTLGAVQALAARVDSQNMRLISLEARVKALENGSVSSASGSPITIASTSLASAFNAFGAFISKGIAQFGSLVADRFVAATNSAGTSSAGTITVLTGNTVAQVTNAYVLPTSKIFVTFNSQITGSWWVSDKTAGSFRVVLSAPQATDVSFDYFLVQTEGQLATSTPMVGGSQTSNASSGSLTSDTTPPVITLLGDNPVRLSVGGTFVEPGVTIVDDVDGTLSTYVTYVNGIEQPDAASVIDTSSETTYIITYSATDQRGNGVTATRSVIVGSDTTSSTTTTTTTSADTIAPVVTLVGEAALQITVGDTFTDLGATASDDVDGDLTANIAVTGSVDTAIAGSYSLTYSATDKAGNIGSASRMVTVVAAPAAGAASSTPAS